MADGTVEYVGKNTVGDELGLMPNGYYFQSPQFIDPLTAQCLASTCAYLGWVLPSNTLTGMFLFTTECVLFFVGLSCGGTTYPWKSAEFCTLVISIMALVGFFIYEAHLCSRNP
ncbi:hypothetical protein FVER53590_28857 [Fusarium verticillioides]|nr:hypothetical protein FVER53590_28857 [Fusarium verticillioides]